MTWTPKLFKYEGRWPHKIGLLVFPNFFHLMVFVGDVLEKHHHIPFDFGKS
jgi:hypothetical protein